MFILAVDASMAALNLFLPEISIVNKIAYEDLHRSWQDPYIRIRVLREIVQKSAFQFSVSVI